MKAPHETRVVFQNDGIIDPKSWSFFGVNAKSGDSPIGEFGTGLKYSIAGILRLGGRIEIWMGLKKISFFVKPGEFRDKSFFFICEDWGKGEETTLPYTTDLGAKWEPWMYFRELYCNALDEGGIVAMYGDVFPEEGKTTIVVDEPGLLEAFLEKDDIVMPKRDFLWKTSSVTVYEGRSRFIYRRGVRAGTAPGDSAYTYDLPNAELTEDRVFKNMSKVMLDISYALSCDAPPAIVDRVLDSAAVENTLESKVDFDQFFPSDYLLNAIENRMKIGSFVTPTAERAARNSKSNADQCKDMDDMEISDELANEIRMALEKARSLGFDYPIGNISFKEGVLPGGSMATVTSHQLFVSSEYPIDEPTLTRLIVKAKLHESYHSDDARLDAAINALINTIHE